MNCRYHGAAVWNDYESLSTFRDCYFRGNNATYFGGALSFNFYSFAGARFAASTIVAKLPFLGAC